MRLDRNKKERRNKYGVIRRRGLDKLRDEVDVLSQGDQDFDPDGRATKGEVVSALRTLERAGVINWGEPGSEDEHFVLMLKDVYAREALVAYGQAARSNHDDLYGTEVLELADRAGPNHPNCKRPD